jgi:hypothetical protein
VNRLSSQSILVRVLVRVRLVLNVQLTDQQLEALFHAGSGLRLSWARATVRAAVALDHMLTMLPEMVVHCLYYGLHVNHTPHARRWSTLGHRSNWQSLIWEWYYQQFRIKPLKLCTVRLELTVPYQMVGLNLCYLCTLTDTYASYVNLYPTYAVI